MPSNANVIKIPKPFDKADRLKGITNIFSWRSHILIALQSMGLDTFVLNELPANSSATVQRHDRQVLAWVLLNCEPAIAHMLYNNESISSSYQLYEYIIGKYYPRCDKLKVVWTTLVKKRLRKLRFPHKLTIESLQAFLHSMETCYNELLDHIMGQRLNITPIATSMKPA